jgi:hypothetical protein
MFNYFAKVWTDRLASEQWAGFEKDITFSVVPVNPTSVEELAIEDWELAAIDFHCSNILDQLKTKRTAEGGLPFTYSEAELKGVMWHLGSSITNKELVPYSMPKVPHTKQKEYEAIWEDIKDDIKILQAKILRERK